MTITLPPELEQFIEEKVASGHYRSHGEAVREGIRLLKEQDAFYEARLSVLKREIARGIEQADNGETIPGEEVFRNLLERNQKAVIQQAWR